MLSLSRRIEKEVRSFFEGSQHDSRILHFIDSISCESNHPALAGHHFCQQVDMPWVDVDTMLSHGLGDLVNDAVASGFDSQVLLNLQDMIGEAPSRVNSIGPENLLQS